MNKNILFAALLSLPLSAVALPDFMTSYKKETALDIAAPTPKDVPEPVQVSQWFGSRQKKQAAQIPTYDATSAEEELASPTPEQNPYGLPEQPVRPVIPAETYLAHGIYGKAAALFAAQPQTADVRLKLAKAQVGLNQLDRALQTLRPMLEVQDVSARIFHGHVLLHAAETAHTYGHIKKAESYLNQYAAAYGESHPALTRYHRLAETLGQIKRTPQRRNSFWQRDSADLPSTESEKQFFRVGVLLPLTGNMAPVGQDILRGLQMSLFAGQNKNSNSITILYPQDTGGTPQGSAAAAGRALKLGADILIGPIAASNVEAAASVAKRSRTPLLAFSSTAAIAAPNLYLMGYIPQQQAKAAARLAVAQESVSPTALVPSTEFGYEVLSAYTDQLKPFGLNLTQTGFYNAQNADVGGALNTLLKLDESRLALDVERRELQQLADDLGGAMDVEDRKRLQILQKEKPTATIDFDSLFLPATATGLNLITAQMATYDADKANFLLLGTAAWNPQELSQTPPEYIGNGRFFAPKTPEAFIENFTNAYGTPPHPLAVLGYDAASIAQSIATEVHHAAQKPADALLRQEGFVGLGGPVRFLENGTTERAYGQYRVTPRGVRLTAEAPALLPPLYDVEPAAPSRVRMPTFSDTSRFLPFQ